MNPRRRGGLSWIRPVALLASLALAPVPIHGQVRDTARVDTLRVDTLLADTLQAEQDTLLPPPLLVDWPSPQPQHPDLAGLVWTWDRDALLSEGAVTLLDLLGRIPGVVGFRSGVFLQPEAATSYGGGAGRTVVEWDGYVLDPLSSASLDLSTIELVHLREVRVERRGDLLRIRLRSDAPRDAQPYSRIEAGVGEPSANLFRGILLSPRFLLGPVGLAVERVELEGAGRPQPADMFTGWLRWGLLSESRGVELVLRSDRLTRDPESPRPLDLSRQDLVVRGRTRLAEGVVAEAYLGRSGETLDETDPAIPDSLRARIDRSSSQAGLRLGWDASRFDLDAAVRWRSSDFLPRIDLEATALAVPSEKLELGATVSHQRWTDGPSTSSWNVSAAVMPLGGVRAFVEYSDGERAAPVYDDTIGVPRVGSRSSVRGGVHLSRGRMAIGFAGLRLESDSVLTFGLPSDGAARSVPGGSVDGWEATLRLPIAGTWLSGYGTYSSWTGGVRWAYLPSSLRLAGLQVHTVPLESGNFELLVRIEAATRGSMSAPPLVPEEPPPQVAERTLLNAYLQIRIIDVRIYARFDDMIGEDIEDLPGLGIRGPRILYGVKWNFWN